jgi:hypothetical protein
MRERIRVELVADGKDEADFVTEALEWVLGDFDRVRAKLREAGYGSFRLSMITKRLTVTVLWGRFQAGPALRREYQGQLLEDLINEALNEPDSSR